MRTKEEFFSDVEEMIRLYSEGKSARQVAEEIGKGYRERFVSTVLKLVGISNPERRKFYWKGERNPRWNRPDLNPTPALAYLLGVYYGDASVDKRGSFRLSVTSKVFAESFRQAIEKIGLKPWRIVTYIQAIPNHGDIPAHTSTFYCTGIGSKALSGWLQEMSLSKVRDFLGSNEMKREFLRGVYESEGTFSPKSQQIIISNTNLELLELCKKLLEDLGFEGVKIMMTDRESFRGGIHRKSRYRLYFGRKSQLRKFIDEIKPVIKK
jgi:hypothetical protein